VKDNAQLRIDDVGPPTPLGVDALTASDPFVLFEERL